MGDTITITINSGLERKMAVLRLIISIIRSDQGLGCRVETISDDQVLIQWQLQKILLYSSVYVHKDLRKP